MGNQDTPATVLYCGPDLFIGTTPSGYALTLDTDSKRSHAPSPMELLLLALGSCTAVDVMGILKKKRERIHSYRVEITGDRRDEHPRKYTQLRVHHIFTGHNISHRAVAHAIELSETKYCSVVATLKPGVEILSSFETIEESEGS